MSPNIAMVSPLRSKQKPLKNECKNRRMRRVLISVSIMRNKSKTHAASTAVVNFIAEKRSGLFQCLIFQDNT